MIDPTQRYEEKYYEAKDEFLSYLRNLKSNLSKMSNEEIYSSLNTILDKFFTIDNINAIYHIMKGIDYAYDHEKGVK